METKMSEAHFYAVTNAATRTLRNQRETTGNRSIFSSKHKIYCFFHHLLWKLFSFHEYRVILALKIGGAL